MNRKEAVLKFRAMKKRLGLKISGFEWMPDDKFIRLVGELDFSEPLTKERFLEIIKGG